MREKLFELADCLDLTLLNPLEYPGEWMDRNLNWSLNGKWIAVFSALSLAVGSTYISPPYTKGFFIGVLIGSIANFFILLFLPVVLGAVLDYWAQKKERKGSAKMMVDFLSISISIFMLYAPLCILFQTLGLTGFGASLIVLVLNFAFFLLILSRGVKYIYDLKDQDSFRFALGAVAISFFYPLAFNFYMTSYFLHFTL